MDKFANSKIKAVNGLDVCLSNDFSVIEIGAFEVHGHHVEQGKPVGPTHSLLTAVETIDEIEKLVFSSTNAEFCDLNGDLYGLVVERIVLGKGVLNLVIVRAGLKTGEEGEDTASQGIGGRSVWPKAAIVLVVTPAVHHLDESTDLVRGLRVKNFGGFGE